MWAIYHVELILGSKSFFDAFTVIFQVNTMWVAVLKEFPIMLCYSIIKFSVQVVMLKYSPVFVDWVVIFVFYVIVIFIIN